MAPQRRCSLRKNKIKMERYSGKPRRGAGLAGMQIKWTRQEIAPLWQKNVPCLNRARVIAICDQHRRMVGLFVLLQILVVIQAYNSGLIYLRMFSINGVRMKNNRLMGVSFNTVLVLLIAVIVLRIYMHMRWRPLEHHKSDKQMKNKNCAGASLDHDNIKSEVTRLGLVCAHWF